MATRRKRNLNFLPAESRTEPAIDISAYPVDIGVGELMRLTRERLGHELQTVANQLRIRLSYLEAIEDSRFRDLPGTTYAVGFVRSYADYLGLDGADIVRRFREEAARIHGTTKLVFPALTAEGKLPRAAVLLVSALGLAVVYGIWYVISSQQQSDLQEIAEVPDRLIALAPSVDEPDRNGSTPSRPAETITADPAPAEPLPVASDPVVVPTEPSPPAAAVAPPESAVVVDPGTGSASAAVPVDPAGEGTAETAPALGDPETAVPAPAAPIVAAPAEAPAAAESSGSIAAVSPISPGPESASAEQTAAIESPLAAPVGETSQPESTEAIVPQVPIPESPVAAVSEPTTPPAPANNTDAIPVAPALPVVEPDVPEQQAALPTPSDAGIVLEARLETWIKVVNANNKTVMQQVLKAGDRYVVPNEPGLVLRTGNAGGLDVLVNGRKAPALGEVGAVYTKIQLDPNRLLDGTAVDD